MHVPITVQAAQGFPVLVSARRSALHCNLSIERDVDQGQGVPFADVALVALAALKRLVDIHHLNEFLVNMPQQCETCATHCNKSCTSQNALATRLMQQEHLGNSRNTGNAAAFPRWKLCQHRC